jgi:hypothetical protein
MPVCAPARAFGSSLWGAMKRPSQTASRKHLANRRAKSIVGAQSAVMKTRIVFDVETEQFTQDFRQAKDIKARLAHAPKMRLACAFDGVRWMYFLPSEVPELAALLLKADEVVTFNGKPKRRHCSTKARASSASCTAAASFGKAFHFLLICEADHIGISRSG